MWNEMGRWVDPFFWYVFLELEFLIPCVLALIRVWVMNTKEIFNLNELPSLRWWVFRCVLHLMQHQYCIGSTLFSLQFLLSLFLSLLSLSIWWIVTVVYTIIIDYCKLTTGLESDSNHFLDSAGCLEDFIAWHSSSSGKFSSIVKGSDLN